MNKNVSGRYEFEIICPDGKVEITQVFGRGFSEGGAFVDAKGAAGLKAFEKDEVAHLECGTHKIGRGRRVTEWS